MEMNYPGGTKIGNEVEAYIYPEKPEELYLYYSNSFAVYIMLIFALFFLWMGNGYKRGVLALCFCIIGVVSIVIGLVAGTVASKVWGTIFIILALIVCKKKIKKAETV